MIVVYFYRNKINDKMYIGQTNDWIRRHSEHLCKTTLVIDRAIKKYGIGSFEYDILEEVTNYAEANKAESFWIKYFNSISPNGYNLTFGGHNAEKSEETKHKMSQAAKGKNTWTKGIKRSDLTKQKMSVWQKADKHYMFGKEALNKTCHDAEQKIIKQYVEGLSVNLILSNFNIGKTTLYRILNRNNISKNRYLV